jgi:hypothetical protein
VKKLLRLLAVVVVATVAGGLLTACDASPYAAVVNGTVIKETSVNQLLAQGDRSVPYLDLQETIYQQSTGRSVGLVGTGSGTHTRSWAAMELTDLIQAALVHQAVVATHRQPRAALRQAALSVLQAELTPAGIATVAPSLRDQLAQQIAEHAAIEPSPTTISSALKQIYDQYRADFYSRVCVRQITVSVPGAAGGVNYPASLSQAEHIVAQINSPPSIFTGGSSSAASGGSITCFSQAGMQSQPVSFVKTVMGLAPGKASTPQRTGLGYTVLAVVSRRTEPFAGPVAAVLQAVILQRQPLRDKVLLGLDARARVKVQSAYGTWFPGGPGVDPGVIAPSVTNRVPGG